VSVDVGRRPRSRSRGRLRLPVPLSIALCLLVVAAVALLAICGSALAPQDPSTQDLLSNALPPDGAHLLGTDDLGRDVLSRTLAGTRTAVVGPAIMSVLAMLAGSVLGLLAGYHGGRVEAVIMRVSDLLWSLPALMVSVVVVGIVGGGYWVAVAILVVLVSPYDTRVIRAATLEQRSRPYVESARLLGIPAPRIMARHIWPNLAPLILANTFLNFALGIVLLSSLSFLGLGVAPGTADWGRMLAESRELIFDNPAAALAPGIAIPLTAACVNVVGDWIAETMADRGATR
jgi:peptide/nickel transport system permease protein